jgi:hypothetical protein
MPPYYQKPSPWGPALAALGKGLTAAGDVHPGTFAGAAFAKGLGGAITGGEEEKKREQERARQAWHDKLLEESDFFKNTVSAYHAELEGKVLPYKLGQMQANIDWLSARAGNAGNPLAKASSAWQLSDIGRLHNANKDAEAEITRTLQGLKEAREAGVDTTKQLESWEATQEKIRQKHYRAYGVDPKTAKGTSQDNSVDVTGMPRDHMLAMPDGTFYKYKDAGNPKADKDGYVYKRRNYRATPPPTAPAPAPPPTQAGTPNDMDEFRAAQMATTAVE